VAKQTREPGPRPGPGPGRSTADAAFIALKKEIAQRNEQAQSEARKVRATREQDLARRRRYEDLR
jgi:hypothetical protein